MESKLGLDDELTMDMVDQFLGITYLQKMVIPHKKYNVVIDLSEDRLYILTKTGKTRNENKPVFRVKRIFVWSEIVKMLLYKGGLS